MQKKPIPYLPYKTFCLLIERVTKNSTSDFFSSSKVWPGQLFRDPTSFRVWIRIHRNIIDFYTAEKRVNNNNNNNNNNLLPESTTEHDMY
jgi:hypothetical protein